MIIKKIMSILIMSSVLLTGCLHIQDRKEGESLEKELSYADTELLAAIGTSYSSRERAREAIEAGAEINQYDESQIEIYNQPHSKDRIRLLTPIRIAFNQGALNIVQELVKAGADINIEETDGMTPLMFVASRGDDLEQIEFLVESGADATYKNKDGLSVLDCAASSKHRGTDVLKYLVEHGGYADGYTVKRALEARYPDYSKAEYLIQECEKNGEEWGVYEGYTIPYLAAFGTADRLEREMAGGGHSWDEKDHSSGDSILMVAASMGNLNVMQYLINSGANIQFTGLDGGTALTRAASNGRYDAVKLLMDSGYEFLPYNEESAFENELHGAAENGDTEMMKLLFAYGFQLKKKSLHFALDGVCKSGNHEAIDLLVNEAQKQELKADFDYGNGLIDAIDRNDLETVEYLLKTYGVNINKLDGWGLNAAVKENNIEMVRYLLNHGAKVNPDVQGEETPLYCAVNCSGIEMVELLVEAGADIEQPVWNEETVVMSAAATSSRILKYLVEKGADINKQSTEGVTCLYYAVIGGKRENVEFLLSQGVDTSPVIKDGKTAYQIAKDKKDKEILRIFKKYGKNS